MSKKSKLVEEENVLMIKIVWSPFEYISKLSPQMNQPIGGSRFKLILSHKEGISLELGQTDEADLLHLKNRQIMQDFMANFLKGKSKNSKAVKSGSSNRLNIQKHKVKPGYKNNSSMMLHIEFKNEEGQNMVNFFVLK
jgi:hypothetical protein